MYQSGCLVIMNGNRYADPSLCGLIISLFYYTRSSNSRKILAYSKRLRASTGRSETFNIISILLYNYWYCMGKFGKLFQFWRRRLVYNPCITSKFGKIKIHGIIQPVYFNERKGYNFPFPSSRNQNVVWFAVRYGATSYGTRVYIAWWKHEGKFGRIR